MLKNIKKTWAQFKIYWRWHKVIKAHYGPWDYSFSMNVLREALIDQYNYIKEFEHVKFPKKELRKLQTVIKLLGRMSGEENLDRADPSIKERIPDDLYVAWIQSIDTIDENGIIDKGTPLSAEYYKALELAKRDYEKEKQQEKDDYALLIKLLNGHWRNWWV